MRVDSGALTTAKNGGWIHKLVDGPIAYRPPVRREPQEQRPAIDCVALQQRYSYELTYERLMVLAKNLGVSDVALLQLGTGYDERQDVFTFPMRSARGEIVGFRVRNKAGEKWCVTGSRNALFIPSHAPDRGPMFIVEGPTDVAAILTIGYAAIGRPSNTGGLDDVTIYCSGIRRPVVIMHDRDESGSMAEKLTEQGAEKLAAKLQPNDDIFVMCPPRHKDAREWIAAGANRAVIECVIKSKEKFKADKLSDSQKSFFAVS